MSATLPAFLALENGRVFRGRGFGALGLAAGEAVFNTTLTGYQEVFTDPSYRGQIVVMTCPQIGNVGINQLDHESARPWLAGVVVRELSPLVSNWRSEESLGSFLERYGVPAIEGVDTRAVTLLLREQGALRAVLACGEQRKPDELVELARSHPGLEGRDLVSEVTRSEAGGFEQPGGEWYPQPGPLPAHHVVAYDFGVKRSILRRLVDHGCRLTVVPAETSAEQVLALRPDGVFLSNGPGDPAPLERPIESIRGLLGRVPVFGICLGHQLLALALGGRSYKLKFGHHGGNHPVKRLAGGEVEITAQNHGFAVDPDSLPAVCEPTHINLNDHTLEGFRHRELPVMAVQYHPESSPGPHDSHYLFRDFIDLMQQAGG